MTNLSPTQFTDLQGTVWDAALTIAAAKRVDSVDYSAVTKIGRFSLLRPEDGLQGFFSEILMNTGFLFAVLFDIMHKQVSSILSKDPVVNRPEAETEFVERMGGPQIITARKALWSALQDFFPDQKTVLQKLWQSYDKGLQMVNQRLDQLEPEATKMLMDRMDQEVDRLMQELRGSNSAE